MKQAWIRLLLFSLLIVLLAWVMSLLDTNNVVQSIILGSANFWLGVYWAKDSIAAGKMHAPATPGIRWDRWKRPFNRLRL